MGSIGPMGGPALVVVGPGAANGSPPASPSLLPEPASQGLGGLPDAMAMMYRLLSRQGTLSLVAGENGVVFAQGVERSDLHNEADAIRREQQAADEQRGKGFWDSVGGLVEDLGKDLATGRFDLMAVDTGKDLIDMANSPHFWNDIKSSAGTVAKWAALIGSCIVAAAASVVTFGAGAALFVVIAAVALSVGGFAVSETKCLDGLLGKGASQWVGVGMELVGTVVTCGASSAGTATSLSTTLSAVGEATSIAGGAAQIASGASTVALGHFDAIAEDARADVKAAGNVVARDRRFIEAVIAGVKEINESNRSALSTLQGAMQTYGQTQLIAASGKA